MCRPLVITGQDRQPALHFTFTLIPTHDTLQQDLLLGKLLTKV